MKEKELIRLKKKVDTAEYEEQQLKGEREATLVNLKENFDCSTIEEAREARKKLKKKREKVAVNLESKLKEINEKYSPDGES